jgi:hypothetical protein
MSFLGAVTQAVQSTVKQVEQTVAQVKAAAPAPPSLPKIRDAFEQAPRPKLDLGARMDSNGLSASLNLHVGRASLPIAAFTVGLAGTTVSDGRTTAGFTAKEGLGVSTKLFGDTLGVQLKQCEGAATLGVIDVKAGGTESALGMVAGPVTPQMTPIYLGDERK